MVVEPPDAFRSFARWLVREGVDVVHGHSAHVFQGVEVVDGTPVCYDTGDFVDDYAVDRRLGNDRSFLFELRIERATPTELRLSPTEIREFAVHDADADTAAWSRARMRERSAGFDTAFRRAGEELVVPLGE
jgi:poly-gamma-glutamate synthesis protein (capsule biosynthesis protein)